MPKRPRDPNQLAKIVVGIATGDVEDVVSESKRHPHARRSGGIKGGKARAAKLTLEERHKIAGDAAKARWGKKGDDGAYSK